MKKWNNVIYSIFALSPTIVWLDVPFCFGSIRPQKFAARTSGTMVHKDMYNDVTQRMNERVWPLNDAITVAPLSAQLSN